MQISQRKAGVLLSYLGEAVRVLTGLVYTPIMLRLLGQSEYGLYQLVSSTVAYLSLLNLGFGSAYVRFYSRYAVKKDEKGIAKLNGMFLLIFCVLAIVCVGCGSWMVGNGGRLFKDGLTTPELAKAKVLLAILVGNMALGFFATVFNCYLTAHERFFFQRILGLGKNVLNPFLSIPLLLLGYGSVALVVVTTGLTVVSLSLDIYYCVRKLKMQFSFRGLHFSLLWEMWAFTFFIFLNQIIDQLNWNVDKFILGRYCGTAAVAVYGVGGQINNLFMALTNKLPSVFIPEVNRLVMENKKDSDYQLSLLVDKVGRIVFILTLYIFVGFIFCGRNFVRLWAGEGYRDAYYVSLLLIAPLVYSLPHALGIEIRRAKNKHQLASVIMLATTIGNTLISIPLSIYFGVIGAAGGTFLCLIINRLFINSYYIKVVNLELRILHKSMRDIFVACSVPVIFGLMGLLLNDVYINILWAIVYTIVYFSFAYIFALKNEEKAIIKRFITKIRGFR